MMFKRETIFKATAATECLSLLLRIEGIQGKSIMSIAFQARKLMSAGVWVTTFPLVDKMRLSAVLSLDTRAWLALDTFSSSRHLSAGLSRWITKQHSLATTAVLDEAIYTKIDTDIVSVRMAVVSSLWQDMDSADDLARII